MQLSYGDKNVLGNVLIFKNSLFYSLSGRLRSP